MKVVELDAENGFSKVSFTPNAHMINFGGVVQGGFLTAMMDDAMGFTCFVSMNMKSALATIDLHTHFYKAVILGPITVETRLVRAGKAVAFLEAKLYDQDGELAAGANCSTKLRPFNGLQFEPKPMSGVSPTPTGESMNG